MPPKGRDATLARRPYDLRHAAVSTWLNAGVDPHAGRGLGGPQRPGTALGGGLVRRRASRPVGRVLCTRPKAGRRPSICDCRYRQPRRLPCGTRLRSTREHRAGRPQTLAQPRGTSRGTFLTLLRVGFTKPPGSLRALVVSYTTVSPLPRDGVPGRSVFCGTFPRVTPGRRYRPPRPAEPGPSSPDHGQARPPGRLARRLTMVSQVSQVPSVVE
jgi:hypothetical protein